MNSISRAVPEVALQAIRKLITEQGFGPGDALPSQRDLAVQLGVSRASLREALSSLSALGVISIQPGKGVFVQSPVELERSEAAPGWPFAAQASPLDIFQLRYALEGFAAGLAAVLRHPARFAGQRVGLVLCGGNIDPMLLASIIERGMVRAGRLARILVNARDVPGNLARITALVAEAGANIDEVHHQRAFTLLAAQNVEIELVLQTRGHAHVQQVIERLQAAGFAAKAE